MYTLLVVLHVIVSLAIIAIVLLQAGKGADIGSAFGGAGSQAVFGSMGTPTLLGKITTGVAIVFMLTSFSLAMLASRRAASVMTQPTPVQQPAPPAGQK
ncbi:MAG: preprotein translocase subunit SecG [Candidatus Rokubacteria bacterium]|nr:preprotein translocase subunit SecG [Candidatus Rokubacteria bacterium]